MDSIDKAISAIHNRLENQELKFILLQFFKDRAIEILEELDKRDLMIDNAEKEIGGTD